MAAKEQSGEARELALVNKVEMRIALSDSDQKVEAMLKTYLAPLLLKLASEHASVRNKVLSICQHLHIRMKPQSIQLPVHALLKQYKEQSNASLVRRFDMVFLEQGIRRLQAAEKADLIPALLHEISRNASDSADRGARIFQLFLELLPLLPLPSRGSKEDEQLREKLKISTGDGQFLSLWLGKLLLLKSANPHSAENRVAPAGLSDSDLEFISLHSGTTIWRTAIGDGLSLIETKVAVARFIASGAFTDDERFLPSLFASTDSDSDVSVVGNEVLKRIVGSVQLEDEALVVRLYDLYLGNGSTPASSALKSRILSIFTKTRKSTEYADNILKIVEEQLELEVKLIRKASDVPNSNRESKKVWSSIFTFLNYVARNGPQKTIQTIAQPLVRCLMEIADQNEAGKMDTNSFAYEAIALLAKASPQMLIEPELIILSWFLEKSAQRKADKGIKDSIEEALATILGAYTETLPLDVEEALAKKLLNWAKVSHPRFHMQQNFISKSTRYNITRFANQCLPYKNMKGRWIDILAIAGNARDHHDLFEEGRRGLDPYWHYMFRLGPLSSTAERNGDRQVLRLQFPSFSSTIQAFFINLPFDFIPSTELSHTEVVQEITKLLGPESLEAMLQFSRMVFVSESLISGNAMPNISVDIQKALQTSITSNYEDRLKIKQYLCSYVRESIYESALLRLLNIALDGLIPGGESSVEAGRVLINFLSILPSNTSEHLASRFRHLEGPITSNNLDVRVLAGQIYGILASHPTISESDRIQFNEVFLKRITTWETAIGAEVNKVHGAIVALAFFFSRLGHRSRMSIERETRLQPYVTLILSILEISKDGTLQGACFEALKELSIFDVLRPQFLCANAPFETTVARVVEAAKSGNEKAIITFGGLGMIFPEQERDISEISFVIEQLRALHEVRQIDVQFSVGEALTYVAAGWQSEALAITFDMEGNHPTGHERKSTLRRILKTTLSDCGSPKPSLKKAALIWLLCFVQFCGHTRVVQELLWDCQNAFKQGLSNRDEFIQETASRGLGIIYRTGSEEMKADLVRDLVSSFTDNKARLAGNVTSDTELFEPGTLPTAEGSVTTYKDIMNLASEVGDTSLVYRFMSLASNNALWSSRVSYGRFALTSIFSDSNAESFLSENPKLYTKLYRYRFDPNSNVQRAMRDIWNTLIPDTTKAIENHFDKIITDLLDNSLVREWRVRQASLNGIAELIRSNKPELFEDYLSRICEVAFKVLDDIKESVRKAAGGLARDMTTFVTRGLEARNASSQKNLSHILPFLLSTSGLESNVEDAQAFALKALINIVKKSDARTLRPFLPETIDKVIRLLSSLEPQAINYVHLNADKYKLTTNEIDDMRMKSIRSSPLIETIEQCLDYLDESAMASLYPRLEDNMKTALGLPSKVGLCRVFVSLSTRHNHLFAQYADRCLNLLSKNLLDRNETVSSSYAAAAGFVSRKASADQILKFLERCRTLYFRSEDDRSRQISGEAILALNTNATDKFQALAEDVLPFIFFAKNDSIEEVKKNFKDAWDNSVAGPRAIRLYLSNILGIIQVHLGSNMWNLKHSAARATSDMVKAIIKSGDVGISDFHLTWPVVEKAVGGKTWDGKEDVLESFVQFVKHTRYIIVDQVGKTDEIMKIALREASRQNQTYRQFSLKSLGDIVLLFDNIDTRGDVTRIVEPIIQETKESHMDIDYENDKFKDDIEGKTLSACVKALADSANPKLVKGNDLSAYLVKVLSNILICNDILSASQQQKVFQHLKSLFQRIEQEQVNVRGYENDEKLAELLEKVLFQNLDGLSESARMSRIEAIEEAIKIRWPGLDDMLKTKLPAEIEKEKSSLVRKKMEHLKPAT